MRVVNSTRQPTQSERIAALEQRADAHDKVVSEVGEKVGEMYDFFTKARTINWFVVKVFAWIGGGLGFVAVLLTIAANMTKLLGR
ncbi:hypothetical protein [Bradyrhizobium liaoningense]|uniref:hypothetical protein n=1 Tax=Bradyrhizobium liaoningense TaxID=43992 RepID=UPI001BABE37C|nr:hypothetical protein [Bradyrhizobium liaoningense]MBR0855502.1 hypothetical protein [Bradyrhizobium liaoningense]